VNRAAFDAELQASVCRGTARRMRRLGHLLLAVALMEAGNAAILATGFWWQALAVAGSLLSVAAFSLSEMAAVRFDAAAESFEKSAAYYRAADPR
jgi:hypothetical protein